MYLWICECIWYFEISYLGKDLVFIIKIIIRDLIFCIDMLLVNFCFYNKYRDVFWWFSFVMYF